MKEKASSSQQALNVWATILICWSFYRAYFRQDLPIWFDELIMKPTVFIFPVWWFISKHEKKPFMKSVGIHLNRILPDVGWGLSIGAALLAAGIFSSFLRSGSIPWASLSRGNFWPVIGLSMATALCEEILSRGFVLKRIYAETGKATQSILLAAFLFFFLRIPILLTSTLDGWSVAQVIFTDLALSIAVSMLFLWRKSLLPAVLVHAFYTVSLSLFM